MAERKPLSKKMRFDVFKRDSFTCQYCGRRAPDVILECDHIVPVAEGGKNTILNLVTSCRDCNRGKGKNQLSDTSVASKQIDQMTQLNEKKEQMEMMLKWMQELENFTNKQIDFVSDLLCDEEHTLAENARAKIKMLINKYGFEEVVTAANIAKSKYIYEQGKGFDYAFNKIGGICYNRANGITGGNHGH